MQEFGKRMIWTIGHSTRDIDDFIAILRSFDIQLVADIRSYPGSRRYPQFNKETLEVSLLKRNISYVHLKDLGGRRKANPESRNMAWRHEAFRGYADYMETDSFKKAINHLQRIAEKEQTAYMCSEAVWWRCHRSLVSDYLKSVAWTVMHIIGSGKAEEHPYTPAATIVNGELTYAKDIGNRELFNE